MKITFKKEFNQLIPYSLEDKEKLESMSDGAVYEVDIKNMDIRTLKQNASLHLWCTQIASSLNDSGLYVSDVLKVETQWNMERVKENIFKPVVEMLYGKKSTTKLNKDEFENIIDSVVLAFANKGIQIPLFPNKDY